VSTTTGIEWTDATWNPVVGCDKVSQGCKFCYAKTLHDRRHRAHLAGKFVARQYAEPFESIQLMYDRLTAPLHWREPKRIFVNSVSDLFHEDVPDQFIAAVFAVMALAPQHDFQILTKRPQRMRSWLADRDRLEDIYAQWPSVSGAPEEVTAWPLPNVWLGVSVENEDAARARIPALRATPAVVRFLSCEPLIGPIRTPDLRNIDWVIVGGESGSSEQQPRPMHPDWARLIRDECVAHGVPFLFKQWGDWSPDAFWPRAPEIVLPPFLPPHIRDVDSYAPHDPAPVIVMRRVGKTRAGRVLDGRTWDEFPR
jgi:protein gp37